MTVILILLLIMYIFGSKKPSNYLYCGLFGWSGKNPAAFSRHAFTILGLDNQNRGRDSCGIFSQGNITYGVVANSLFSSFIKKVSPVKSDKTGVVMGHTRKASIGAVTVENAQPTAIADKDDALKFVLTHNGTLENYKELANKYKISIKNLDTDTQILAAIIHHSETGFTVLSEYEGMAALAYHWVGDKSIYLFKGKSKDLSNNAYESEERPLYIYQESPTSLYYSSEKHGLELIAKDKDKIVDLECNILFRVHEGEIGEIAKIDRSKMYQKYNVVEKRTYANDLYDDYYTGSAWKKDKWERYGSTKKFDYIYPYKPIVSEDKPLMGNSMIYYCKGRYHQGVNLIHGKVVITKYGMIVPKYTAVDVDVFELYFYEGILLYGEEEFEKAVNLPRHTLSTDKSMLMLSPYPIAQYYSVISGNVTNASKLYTIDDATSIKSEFTGKFSPILCVRSYYIRDGLVSQVEALGEIKKLEEQDINHLTYW